MSGGFSANAPRQSRRRLIFETLGQRRVLAVITGEVFHDVDGSMRQEVGEVRLASRLAYIDANDNATLDTDERIAVADADGVFRFEDVSEGIYPVRLFDGSAGQRQTYPAAPALTVLPASFQNPVGAALAGSSVNVLTPQRLLSVEPSGTRVSQLDLPFEARGLVASVAAPAHPGISSIVAGSFSAEGHPRSGLWLVSPGGDEIRLLHQSEQPAGFANNRSAIGPDGNGVVVVEGADGGTLMAIRLAAPGGDGSDPASNFEFVSTEHTVPAGVQIVSSDRFVQLNGEGEESVGSRSVMAWPVVSHTGGEDDGGPVPVDALKFTLWSNSAADWVEGTETVIVGATELVSFDDDAGLLAVRYGNGQISVLDVDGGFSPVYSIDSVEGPIELIPGQDLLAAIDSNDQGDSFVLHDLRDGRILMDHPIDLGAIGEGATILPGETVNQLFLVGQSGVSSIRLNASSSHRVVIDGPDDEAEVQFGVQTDGENAQPRVNASYQGQSNEDKRLKIDAAEIASLISDADKDRLVSVIVDSPLNGQVHVQSDGGVHYEPAPNFFGTDSFRIQFHDGQSLSEPVDFSVTVRPQPDLPTGIRFTGDAIPEHTYGPYTVGTLEVLDPDGPEPHGLFVTDNRFLIFDDRLVLMSGGLNFELEPIINLSVSGYDQELGDYFSQDVVILVSDENDPITDVRPDNGSINENTVEKMLIAELEASDEDWNQAVTFSVDDERFEVEGDQLFLKSDQQIDFETEPEIVLTITANDNAGSSLSVEMLVSVADMPEPAVEIDLSGRSVLELELGAVVGEVRVNGAPASDNFDVTVNDSRFEVAGSTLKLLGHQFVRRDEAEQIEITLTAQDSLHAFDAISETYVIEVVANQSPFHNDENPHDVDGNGTIAPSDALSIIHYLNIYAPGPVGPGDPAYGYDVNGDGMVTALDALLVINILNTIQNGGAVGGENPPDDESVGNPSGAPDGTEAEGEGGIPAQSPLPADRIVEKPPAAGLATESNPEGEGLNSRRSAPTDPLATASRRHELRLRDALRTISWRDTDPDLASAVDEFIRLLEADA